MTVAVIIPFRDRGNDPYRVANLARVVTQWAWSPWPWIITGDGRSGDAPFNRSAAYNRGAAATDADILVYSESDVLIDADQIHAAIGLAADQPGLVVPFTRFMAVTEQDSMLIRDHKIGDRTPRAEQVRGDRESIGAVNVVSRATLAAVGGWDEHFTGAWYDDDAMAHAFTVCTQPARFVDGPVWHLYHHPSGRGDHLTRTDKAATAANRRRWQRYRRARTAADVKALTCG